MEYANIVVDISSGKVDKTFQYIVPEALKGKLSPGQLVSVPFGKGERILTGYVVEITEISSIDPAKLKEVIECVEDSIQIESRLVSLAAWIREQYGGTMIQALKTVLPVRHKISPRKSKHIRLKIAKSELETYIELARSKGQRARVRVLRQFREEDDLPYEVVVKELNIGASSIKSMEDAGWVEVITETIYRNPVKVPGEKRASVSLNEEQITVVDGILEKYLRGEHKTYLIHGVTGSGKTEVYMELIAHAVAQGKQAILLIPEIALTYQTVMRFYHRFGDRVSIMNSKLSVGERYDQYLRAKNGEIDIMIGPRSALFAPFEHLGMIIIDEEHEGSYKSESAPRYHAREVAIERARREHATVILGSATPSVDAFYKAQKGEYELYQIKKRVENRPLPQVYTVDMREELRNGNRTILSTRLQEMVRDRLDRKQQIMLFLNRRGYAGFVSCRACGYVLKCKNCDVSLADHNGGKMLCHYCGYKEKLVRHCPSCGQPRLGRFFAGTEQIEEYMNTEYPEARVLRMDADTTRGKHGHAKILEKFSSGAADILIGTQMIIKGHDFPGVTLVGVLAADMSLFASDYRASERTFQMLTQAAGRAGRGAEKGEVVIQSYDIEHYSIQNSVTQNYEAFYEREITYRTLMDYPPAAHMMAIHIGSRDMELVDRAIDFLKKMSLLIAKKNGIKVIGPADALIPKVNNIFRRVLYIKHDNIEELIMTKKQLEKYIEINGGYRNTTVQFDVNPLSMM